LKGDIMRNVVRGLVGLVCILALSFGQLGCSQAKCADKDCQKPCTGKCDKPCAEKGKPDHKCPPDCKKPCCQKKDGAKQQPTEMPKQQAPAETAKPAPAHTTQPAPAKP
jgi:hypothetical protein